MTHIRVSEAAGLLGVSDDTVRRMVDARRLPAARDDAGRLVIQGADLATIAREGASPAPVGEVAEESARNRMRGIVIRVLRDTVMAQVEVQCGPFRIVSLMSREAADELSLEVGSVVVASIKSTNVVVGVPR
ncbi:MAG: TOBE domain-containing protein [Dermatophilaceae bacterium]